MPLILAIDDREDNLITLRALLKQYFDDAEIVTCLSPLDGVKKAEEIQPDLVIVDYIMPEIDGIEVCRILRGNSKTSSIPVILVTASDTASHNRIAGLEAGADAFLAKPVDEAELAAQVKSMLRIKKSEDLLRDRNRQLKRFLEIIVENSDEAIIGVTLDAEIVSWNSSAERIYGYSAHEVKGCSLSMLVPLYQSDDFQHLLVRIKEGEKIEHYETRGLTKSGVVVDLIAKIFPVLDSSGNITGATITAKDITEEVKAKEKIQKGKSFLKNLEEINPAFYIAIDSKGNILTMNRAMLIATGYSLAQVVGKYYIDLLFHESDRELQKRDFQSMVLKKKSARREYPIMAVDGEEIIVEWHGKPLLNVEGELEFLFYVGIDITERRRLEKSFMETNAAERFRIGQELHSRLVQHLAGITFRGELLKLKISDTSVEALADIDEIMGLVGQAMNKTRELAKELSPVDDNHGGLKNAVDSLKEEIKIKHGVDIHVKWDIAAVIKGKLEISSLYYIISDSVNNSINNNMARNIVLSLVREGNICTLEIRDDGSDYDKIDREKNKAFLSLLKYRSWLIGASVEVSGNPGGGILILCRFKTGYDGNGAAALQADSTVIKSKQGRSRSSVLIVDSHPVVRQGLSQIIDREKDVQICGEASTAEGALNFLGRIVPDLMTVDIALAGSGGLDLIKACRERYPSLPIIVISVYEESIYAERAIRAGARGYVMKNEPPYIILTAIRTVLEGRQYMSDSLKDKLLNKLYMPLRDDASELVDALTDREYEVFQLIGRGLGNKHIAEKLHVSVKTVENYREKLKNKLNIETSSGLVQFAVQWIIDRTS